MTSISTRFRGGLPTPDVSGQGVLDSAHTGDIVGALGRIRRDGTGAYGAFSGRWRRVRTLLVITGPGLIVMVGDNDAGGVATYAQAGQNYGMGLPPTSPCLTGRPCRRFAGRGCSPCAAIWSWPSCS